MGVPFDQLLCTEVFNLGTKLPAISWTNTNYGGIGIDSTNTLFPNGAVDPWHSLSTYNGTGPLMHESDVKVYIQGTSHCEDMYATNVHLDPPALTYARTVIAANVAEWLSFNVSAPSTDASSNSEGSSSNSVPSSPLITGVALGSFAAGALGMWVYFSFFVSHSSPMIDNSKSINSASPLHAQLLSENEKI